MGNSTQNRGKFVTKIINAEIKNNKLFKTTRVSLSKESLFQHHPAMQKLHFALKKELWTKCLLSGLALLCGALMLYFAFEKHIIWSIFGLILTVMGLALARAFPYLWRSDQLPLWNILRYSPERIVWVYSVVTERMPYGFQMERNGLLYFKDLDGEEWSVSLSADDLKLVSRTLNRVLPHATFGYSNEKASLYNQDPKKLFRS